MSVKVNRNKTVKFIQLYFDESSSRACDIKEYTKSVIDLNNKGYQLVEITSSNNEGLPCVGGILEDIDTCSSIVIFADDPSLYKSFMKLMRKAKVIRADGDLDTNQEVSDVFNNSVSWPKKFKEQNPFLIKKATHKKFMDCYEVEFNPDGKNIISFTMEYMCLA
jgi:hypothetical protein